jgi:hypothetical protein
MAQVVEHFLAIERPWVQTPVTSKTKTQNKMKKASRMAHTCNPSTQEVEAEDFWVQGQPGLHSETLYQNK